MKDELLSNYSRKLKDKFSLGKSSLSKLTLNNNTNTNNKHYRNLKLCLKLGMKLTKMRCFNQKP